MFDSVKKRLLQLFEPSLNESLEERRRNLLDIMIFILALATTAFYVALTFATVFLEAARYVDFRFTSVLVFLVQFFCLATYIINHRISPYISSFIFLTSITAITLIQG
jgi:hypothetical protein